ncbi:hypothetical protein [Paractinoplanes globisporus]|uniref:Uncharacterized protein n=1 Tax=Paractinoplanes globisporus TaxID=113565 RepID=A0ABW6WHA9_9ACTN|nr:hypothetical protein [Actinoplanes globisporus]
MSFGLVVVAIDPSASDDAVRAMVERCRSASHPEGELDERVVGFYEHLRSSYPDFPPYGDDSPWMSMPLDVGIDHVSMLMSFGQRSTPALSLIDDLAQRYGLTIYDPQGDEVTRPGDIRMPLDPALLALMESLRSPES